MAAYQFPISTQISLPPAPQGSDPKLQQYANALAKALGTTIQQIVFWLGRFNQRSYGTLQLTESTLTPQTATSPVALGVDVNGFPRAIFAIGPAGMPVVPKLAVLTSPPAAGQWFYDVPTNTVSWGDATAPGDWIGFLWAEAA